MSFVVPESETPETDACIAEYREGSLDFAWTLTDLARSLERRLSLAQTEIKGYRSRESDLDIGALQRALDEAQARIDELEKDAARYRWLRDNPYKKSARMLDELVPEELDAAIDAALKDRA